MVAGSNPAACWSLMLLLMSRCQCVNVASVVKHSATEMQVHLTFTRQVWCGRTDKDRLTCCINSVCHCKDLCYNILDVFREMWHLGEKSIKSSNVLFSPDVPEVLKSQSSSTSELKLGIISAKSFRSGPLLSNTAGLSVKEINMFWGRKPDIKHHKSLKKNCNLENLTLISYSFYFLVLVSSDWQLCELISRTFSWFFVAREFAISWMYLIVSGCIRSVAGIPVRLSDAERPF